MKRISLAVSHTTGEAWCSLTCSDFLPREKSEIKKISPGSVLWGLWGKGVAGEVKLYFTLFNVFSPGFFCLFFLFLL